MLIKEILDHKYNHHILKHFDFEKIKKFIKNDDITLNVALALQFIKIKTLLSNKKLNVHIHPKTDLDQKLSLHYIQEFLGIQEKDMNIIEWPKLEVKVTNEYDIVVDISVSKDVEHKNILVFDHHNGESSNTLEQLRCTICPQIPENLVYYVDRGYVPESNILEPQNIFFLKDFSVEEIIKVFQDKVEYQPINRFFHKDLYKKWKERKRKSFKTSRKISEECIHESPYGDVAITFDNLYNAHTIALHYLNCRYFVNIKEIDDGKSIIVVMTKDDDEIDNDIINVLKSFSNDVFVYPNKTMAMVGSLHSNYKYINSDMKTVYEEFIKKLRIKESVVKRSFKIYG